MNEHTADEIHLTIDGNSVSVPKGTTVYNAAKQIGIDIPIFCYQDRMPPFGACRMCLVQVEKMPKLQASCTLEVSEGMVVNTKSQHAIEERDKIVELLLINHPLDCPICDRGGECLLQENALEHGSGTSRFFEDKRRFKKPLPLGPTLALDRERCIVCARCTRFSDLIAGDHALEFIERGYKTEVGTPDGQPVDSKFIGNTIMICPVGALTSQVYRFRARPWDNDPTNTTCTLCPVGCNMILDARDGEIMRTRSRQNADVNDIWLCDKGWFGYEYTSHPNRLTTPLIRRGNHFENITWNEAFSLIAKKIDEAKPKGKLAGFGGAPLTNEENYFFQQFMQLVAGVKNVDYRIGTPIFSYEDEGMGPGMEIAIRECEELSFAVLCGIDLTEEFPVIWLRLRQAINKGAKVIFIGHFAPEISSYFSEVILHCPGAELETLQKIEKQIDSLVGTGKGALFVGKQYLGSIQRKSVLSELAKLRQKHSQLSLNLLEGRGNSMGARFAGMHPELTTLGKRAAKPGLNAIQVMEEASSQEWDYLHVAGANPAKKYPSKLWKSVREKLGFLVVQDLFLTETASEADLVLPVLSFVEKGGTTLNIEARMQRLLPGKEIPNGIYSDGQIFNFIAQELNVDLSYDIDFLKSTKLGRLPLSIPEKIEISTSFVPKNSLSATFAHALFDNGVRMKHNPHVSLLAKDPYIRIHPNEGKLRGLEDNNRAVVTAHGNSIQGTIKLDSNVAQGTAVLPLGFEQFPVQELGSNLLNGLPIEIKKL